MTLFPAYLQGMETQKVGDIRAVDLHVPSLPTRNGNQRRQALSLFSRRVPSLPTRNGNGGAACCDVPLRHVPSLPTRNGNCWMRQALHW